MKIVPDTGQIMGASIKYSSASQGMIGTEKMLLIICLCMILCCCGLKECYTGISPVKLPLKKPIESMKLRSMFECVCTCLRLFGCRSLTYEKTNTVCQLFDTHTDVTLGINKSAVLYISLTVVTSNLDHTTVCKSHPESKIVLGRGDMTWREASHECRKINRTLLDIDNAEIQATAVNMLKGSGLQKVAIYVHLNYMRWYGRHKRLNYSAWADGEPRLFNIYGVMSKKSGYKWESTNGDVDGRLCEIWN